MNSKKQIEQTADGLLVRAPAKINLSLLIAGKRPDGFHEIKTLMAKVNWYDELLLATGDRPGIELTCTGRHWAPEGPANLVFRACELLCNAAVAHPNIKVTLKKNIPAGSGLGSASSDAAAALVGLNLWAKLDLPASQLQQLAAQFGSDVPFFLGPPLSLCTGRGEKTTPVEKKFDFLAILMLPGVTVSTKIVYENYKHDANLYNSLNTAINRCLGRNRVDLAVGTCANMLNQSCLELYPELGDFKAHVESLGLGPVFLSGSGSTMFLLLVDADRRKAQRYVRILRKNIGCETILVNNNSW